MSCGSSDKGELVGVKGKKYFSEKPFGMALVPGGAFTMGKSDDDLVGIQDAPTKTVTVRPFYMDETEITNAEYRQFVHWVRDSIILTRMANIVGDELEDEEVDGAHKMNDYAYIGVESGEDNNADNTDEWDAEKASSDEKKRLNWRAELILDENDYLSEQHKALMDDMRIKAEDTWNGIPSWKVKQFQYKTSFPDIKGYLKAKESGGYIYVVQGGDKGKSFAQEMILKYAEEGFDPDLANELVYEPSISDMVTESKGGFWNYINDQIENDPEFQIQQMENDLPYEIEYKKILTKDINMKDFINEKFIEVYPDTAVWYTDHINSYNEPMALNYFAHDAYNDYPVVGVTWEQAKAFCKWRTHYKNGDQKSRNKNLVPQFRLPTEAEWEFAARGGLDGASYPWGGPYTKDDRGTFLANFKPMRGDYALDCALYTVEGESYEANDYGLYNMAGNVAEWVDSSYESDAYDFSNTLNPNVNNPKNSKKVTRGGSWKDVKYYLEVSSRNYEYKDKPRSYIGFRTVHDYLGPEAIITVNSQTNISRIKK